MSAAAAVELPNQPTSPDGSFVARRRGDEMIRCDPAGIPLEHLFPRAG
jgi:hypothetical protein